MSFIQKAKDEFSMLVGTPEEIGEKLYSISKSNLTEDAKEFIMEQLKKVSVENKNLTDELGSITKDELFNLPVVIPSNNVILAFNKKTLSIFNYQLSIEKETQKLTAMRDRLLPLLMNGQVNI